MTVLENYFKHQISQAGFDLFAVFARFEYAMKKGGYRRSNHPEAAWPIFAESLPEDFFQQMKDSQEASIFFSDPPDHLVINTDGGVGWSNNPRVPVDAAALFESIKTARNNLFHGDKAHDSNRDTNLMTAALFVLNAAFKAAKTEDHFDDFIAAMDLRL